MVRRIFSLILRVDKGFQEEDIAEWLEDRLIGVVNYHLFKTIAVTPGTTHDIIYSQLRVLHYTSITEEKLKACLAKPPRAIQVVTTKRLENGDNVAVLPLRPVVFQSPVLSGQVGEYARL